MATPQEVIRAFMQSLDRTTLRKREALDQAVRASSNFSSWQNVIDSMVSDCASYGGEGDRFLQEKCGIILSNEDTGAITGADAGAGVVKTAESVVPEDAPLVYPTSGTSTFYGLTAVWPNKNSLTQSQQLIIAALNSWWIPNALQLIKESYGLSFEESDASVKTISVNFVTENSDTLAYVKTSGTWGAASKLSLNINMKYYSSLIEDDPNGRSANTSMYLDRTIAHEMTHAIVAATVYGTYSLPHYFEEGIAELTHGIDDERTYEIQRLASDASRLSRVLTDNVDAGTQSYAGGYMLLRYFAHQASSLRHEGTGSVGTGSTGTNTGSTGTGASSSGLPAGMSISGTTLVLDATFSTSLWLGGTDLFSGQRVYQNNTVVRIDATQTVGSVVLAGNAQNNVILAGSGNTSLWGGASGNDTLQGGAGRDMFWFGAGDGADHVVNFATGAEDVSDVLNFYSSGITSISRNNGLLTIRMTSNSTLSVNVGAAVDAAIQYSEDASHIQLARVGNTNGSNQITYEKIINYYQGGQSTDTLIVRGSETSSVWLDGRAGQTFDSIEYIDASSATGTEILAGNAASNFIVSGSGTASLWGGIGGNDTLQGGNGQDMFWYGKGQGNDVIRNGAANDIVNLYDVSLQDITSIDTSSSSSAVSLGFRDGGHLSVSMADGISPTFILGADNSAWRYNRGTRSWQAG